MKILATFLFCIFALPALAPQAPAQSAKDTWMPADFQGIKLGSHTRQEAIAILGTPELSSEADANDLPEGEEPGDLLDSWSNVDIYREVTVISSKDTGKVTEIVAIPKFLSVAQANRRFGTDFVRTRYEMLECPGDAGSSLIYESKTGSLEFVEYRSKGIALTLDARGRRIEEVRFVSRPIGLETGVCPAK